MARKDWNLKRLNVERACGETWVSYGERVWLVNDGQTKGEVSKNGEYVLADSLGYHNRGFIARFRSYHRGSHGWGAFKKFLLANFTPDEYFALMEAGESPMGALRSKGWV